MEEVELSSTIHLAFDQFQTVDEVVFAEPGDQLLLGARTLEGFNARVDSKQKKLVAAGPLVAAGNTRSNK